MAENELDQTINLATEAVTVGSVYKGISAIESVAHILHVFIFGFKFVPI